MRLPRLFFIASALAATLVLVLAVPSSARGDECRWGEDCLIPDFLSPLPADWHWQAHGSITAENRAIAGQDERVAELGAGLDVFYGSRDCRWVGLAVDVNGYADRQERGLSGRETLSLCPPIPVYTPQITLWREREIIPRLAAAPYYRASRFSSYGFGLGLTALDVKGSETTGEAAIRFGNIGFDVAWVSQVVDDELQQTTEHDAYMSMLQIVAPDKGFLGGERTIDILAARVVGRATEAEDGAEVYPLANAVTFSFARLTGLGSGRVSLDLDLGVAIGTFSDVGPTVMNPDGTIEYNLDPRGSVVTYHTDVHLQWGDQSRAQGLRYQHTLGPSSYHTFVVEDRVSGWARRTGDRTSTTLHGFAALSHLVHDDLGYERVLTGGLAVTRDTLAGDYFHLGLTGEVARSFYADLHGTSRVEAGWVAQLSAEIGFQARSEHDSAL